MQSLGNNYNCNNYGRNFLFATSKIFTRFCNQIPKVKYRHEFTKGNFSQSSLKEVTYYIPFDPQKLSLEADPLSKWGVRLQNSSTYSPKRGVRLQNSSTKGGVRLQISSTRWGSASRFHQHTALQKGVRLQNSSTYSPQKGVRLQNSSTYSPKLGVRLQNSSTINLKMGVRLQGQFLWIQRYNSMYGAGYT